MPFMVPAFCPLQTERGVSVSKEYGPRGEWGTFLRLECQPEILLSPMARAEEINDQWLTSRVALLEDLNLVLTGTGRAQVLATGKSAGTEIDFKYVVIGTALGVALSAGFLALKICMIRRHLSDNDSADLKNTPQGAILLKKKSLRDARAIEL
ncbi:transmembrane protein 273 [Rattus rattus]|uniref:transmembrane protein 273 n=1 Tax=Rattus rattus TaxID=10117 RepID=UPI0013F2C278|nr:transmembrane protein 273 [Rattus rattus]